MYLVPIAGPSIPPLEVTDKKGGVTVGRSDKCDLMLPTPHADQVSRFHARFTAEPDGWRLRDLNSRWGTSVNGTKLVAGVEMPLNEGDLVRVTPWTFTFASSPRVRGIDTSDDAGRTIVRTYGAHSMRQHLPEETLGLLLESAAAMHAVHDERKLADFVMDVALRGTGLSNAVMLRPINAEGQIDIIASKSLHQTDDGPPTFSRSLINAAQQGQVAEISPGMETDYSHSIMQMNITQALVIPLMLDESVAAVLYLDGRGGRGGGVRPHATAFCVALGRMASLAMANLKRAEMERRQARMEAELRAAAEAQRWILPTRSRSLCGASILGESRPGQFVGGDFFDVIELGDNRFAIALGDVAGHGIAAAVLMTATQGFLHATLLRDPDPASAVTATNRFIAPRRAGSTFVTLWLGVFDLPRHELRYVDAGHGYALLRRSDGTFEQLNAGEGVPMGADEGASYELATVDIREANEVVVVSDGIVEQCADAPSASEARQFGMENVKSVLSATPASQDAIAALFESVVKHAGTAQFSDDTTAMMVRWK